jgi:fructose-bisphosphate aldolase class II
MALVNLATELQKAYENRYALGSFNISDYILLESIFKAAKASRSPVILSVAEMHLKFLDLEDVAYLITKIAAKADIPIVLHFDHGVHFDAIIRAMQNGFTSVMFDGSKLKYEENVRQTSEIVKICHAVDVSAEGELGGIGGDEGGGILGTADESLFTDPEQARDFVNRTGVDALAVAIGNVHGKYQGEPNLDFKRLEKIKNFTKIPLVLHGGSGISEVDFKRAISLGISKINYYTGMASAALEEIQAALPQIGERYNDYPELIMRISNRIQEIANRQMAVFGSKGKG